MLSKKMAFSLTSLITILALAFVVPAAYSAFDVASITVDDVSEADGIQIEYGAPVVITVEFKEVVAGASVVDGDFVYIRFTGDKEIDRSTVADDGTVSSTEHAVTVARDNNGKKFTLTFPAIPQDDPSTADTDETGGINKVRLFIAAGSVEKLGDPANKNNLKFSDAFNLVNREPGGAGDGSDMPHEQVEAPKVVSITRATAIGSTIASAFVEDTVSGEFLVKIVLTEQPKGGLASKAVADRIAALSVVGGKATNVVAGVSSTGRAATADADSIPPQSEGGYYFDATPTADPVPTATGRDAKYYPYLATIMPDGSKDKVVIKVKDFMDLVKPRGSGATAVMPGEYRMPADNVAKNGREKLEVKTDKSPAAAKAAGLKIDISDGIMVPAGGYLILGRNDGAGDDNHEKRTDSTQIIYPGDPTKTILVGDRQPNQLKYNLIKADLPNLDTFLTNGGVIDVMSTGLVVSEVMWGTDASLATPSHNQWIELYNPGTTAYTAKSAALIFYAPNDAIPPRTAAVAATATTAAVPAGLPAGVSDRVGTITEAGAYWSKTGKGQSGRTGHGEKAAELIAVVPTQAVASMYRVMDATTGKPADGQTDTSWMQSMPPSVNFNAAAIGIRIGSPGAASNAHVFAVPTPPETPPAEAAAAMASDIMITEIMVDTSNGRLPQWIELTNVSGKEVSLEGWSLEIENAADADVIGRSISIDLSGTLGIGGGEGAGGTLGKSLLLVGGTARNSTNLDKLGDRLVDVSDAVDEKGRYTLLSPMGFMITLIPRQMTGIVEYGDMAGNLDAAEAWEIPMSDNGRSSLIRREMDAGMMTKGTDANGWVLASDTPLVSGPTTWYGSDEDAGTPGYDAGGPLPVELSHFRPARDKATGAVVITWATQSELNNAGFFIKRSNQRNGEFQVINATMVPGAGTTSEKQFYTYTDTTAQPNIVYYYQIEDVSLDGNRQTLTRGIRLKGHIGAAGKLTSTWGEIKASNE